MLALDFNPALNDRCFMSSIGTKHIKKNIGVRLKNMDEVVNEKWTVVHLYKINQAYGFKKFNS
jgi:hypothetical protein